MSGKRARRDAAEEVCWSVLLMMTLGGLEIPMEWRSILGDPMEEWTRLAAETGQLPNDDTIHWRASEHTTEAVSADTMAYVEGNIREGWRLRE